MSLKTFEERFTNLNKDQRKAVDTIEGPVLVVAGPGSGKTEILSMRVANILRKTDIPAGAILCLTFTDSASVNMRERLSGLIGTDAYRVQIHTFHSFGVSIINRFPEYFFGSAEFNPADKVTQMEVLSNIFKELSYDNPLRSEHPEMGFVFLSSTLSAISHLKRAGLTPDEFEKIIEHNKIVLDFINPLIAEVFGERLSKKDIPQIGKVIEKIRSGIKQDFPVPHMKSLSVTVADFLETALKQAEEEDKTAPLSEWKTKWTTKNAMGERVLKDLDRLPKMKALADVYRQYQKSMFDLGYYDFDDMLLQTIEVIEKNESLSLVLQEEFQYILVDEFQDTNDAQMRLLRLLTSADVHEGRPNIMVVGDDDQAIYKFQGAEVTNILQFRDMYKNPTIVTLSTNYRSTQKILDLASSVISQGEYSLQKQMPEIQKNLLAGNKTLAKGNIVYKNFRTDLHQFQFVAKEIKKQIDAGESPKNIAVISRTHGIIRGLLPYLESQNIPVEYDRQQNVFDIDYIREIVTIARFVDSTIKKNIESADDLLPEILSFSWWKLPRSVIWDISLKASREHLSWLEVMKNHENSHVRDIAHFLITLAEKALSEPLERIVDLIIGSKTLEAPDNEDDDRAYDTEDLLSLDGFTSPFREFYFESNKLHSGNYIIFLSGLRVFVEALREYKQGTVLKISDLVELVSVYEKNKMELLDTSPFMSDKNAVKLLTSHKAKGLEFDNVFLLSAVDDIWTGSGRGDILPFPKNLPIKPAGDTTDDMLRLFYVALTRAKHTLYMTTYEQNSSGKGSLPIEFLSGLIPEEDNESVSEEEHPLLDAWRSLSRSPYDANEEAMMKSIIENYQMSVTHLNNFLDVSSGGPKTFLEHNLLRFPQAKTVSSVYGTAMHSTMQYIYTELRRNGKIPELSKSLEVLKKKIVEGRLNNTDTRIQYERGEKAFTLYYKLNKDRFLAEDKIETDFKHQGVVIGEARITGKIDKMKIDGGEIIVCDFKTGKPKASWDDKDAHNAVSLHKNKYQLIFYKLLIENAREFSKFKVSQGVLEFLDPLKDTFISLSLEIEDEDVTRVSKLTEIVFKKIMNLDFPDTSKYTPNLTGCIQFEDDLLEGKI